ncbi:MAG: hypothetical protein KY459_05620 [Acidobacteria bacterium]|nr:hypothetical protein [Acidobacteriota bacterium]
MLYRHVLLIVAAALIAGGAWAGEASCEEPFVRFDVPPPAESGAYGRDVAAGHDGRFLVASPGFESAFVTLLDAEGGTSSVTPLPTDSALIDMTVSADPGGYLVFWSEAHHRAETNLHFARIDANGQLVWARPFSTGSNRRATDMDATFDGLHHLLVWSATDFILHGTLIEPDGSVVDDSIELGRAESCSSITAAAGDGFAVAWSISRFCDTAYTVDHYPSPGHIAFLDSRGRMVDAAVLSEDSSGVTVSWNDDHWVTATADFGGITLQKFDPDGLSFGESRSISAKQSMAPSLSMGTEHAALVWYADIHDTSGIGTRFEILVSDVDDELNVTEPVSIGSAYESYVPSPGIRLIRPVTAASCNSSGCIALNPAAIVNADGIRVIGSESPGRPVWIMSFHDAAEDQYLMTVARFGVLHLVALAQDGRVIRERKLTDTPFGNGMVTTNMTADGRYALVTQFEESLVYGWFVNAVTLEPLAERVLIPFGEIEGGTDSFLIAWKDRDDNGYSLHMAIFGVDGEVRLAEPVVKDKNWIYSVAGWLGDRFGVFASWNEGAAILETAEVGPPVASYPVDIKFFSPYATESGDGQLFAASRDRVVEIGSGGAHDVRPFDFGGVSMSRQEAIRWRGRWWVQGYSSRGFRGGLLLIDESGEERIPLSGSLVVEDDVLLSFRTEYSDGEVAVYLERYGVLDPGPSRVEFALPEDRLSEGLHDQFIAVGRKGSIAGESVVRVEATWSPATDDGPIRIEEPIVRFAPGEMLKLVPVTVFDDQVFADWDVTLGLEAVSSGVELGCDRELELIIIENDAPQLRASRPAVKEGDSTRVELIELIFDRGFLVPTRVDVHVDIPRLLHENERFWKDYEPFHGSILVQPGQTTIEVPLVIHGDEEPDISGAVMIEYWYGGRDHPLDGRLLINIIDDDRGRRRATRRR